MLRHVGSMACPSLQRTQMMQGVCGRVPAGPGPAAAAAAAAAAALGRSQMPPAGEGGTPDSRARRPRPRRSGSSSAFVRVPGYFPHVRFGVRYFICSEVQRRVHRYSCEGKHLWGKGSLSEGIEGEVP